ncbi:MAG: serine hydrolase [Planctomycetes bacterium]|nr:serine hydrolase [Planctomycetota bacterium]
MSNWRGGNSTDDREAPAGRSGRVLTRRKGTMIVPGLGPGGSGRGLLVPIAREEMAAMAWKWLLALLSTAAAVTAQSGGLTRPSRPPEVEWVTPAVRATRVTFHTFDSVAAKAKVSYHLYVPAAYTRELERRFPVVYWLHGSGGGLEGIPEVARHFDAAVESGKAPPCLVVFVNGLVDGMYVDWKDGSVPLETVIVTELVPHIDSTNRTIAAREGRMLDGFSMGGYGAARLGFEHPELFRAVSIVGAGPMQAELIQPPRAGRRRVAEVLATVYGGDQDYFRSSSPRTLAEQNARSIARGSLVRIVIGAEDEAFVPNREFHEHLQRLEIPHTWSVLPGVAHDPMGVLRAMGDENWAFYRAAFGEPPASPAKAAPPPSGDEDRIRRREDALRFASQELIPARHGTWLFKPGEPPRIVWRDLEEVRRLGFHGPLRVRWFDANCNESDVPGSPGRWIAWIEGTAPNGTPLRRAMTFYALPTTVAGGYVPDFTVVMPYFPGPNAPQVLREHQAEFTRAASSVVPQAVLDSEPGAILLAGLAEFVPLGRPARFVESATVLNDDAHLALKLELQGLRPRVRPLKPPRRRDAPATVLHQGSWQEAGMRDDAKSNLDAVCKAWAADTGEPFVTLVARHGVVVTHEAFGVDRGGKPVTLDYRCWVGSITKTVTALLFSRFLDQELMALDDRLSKVFPDYPSDDPRVPTFRQCFNHTSGLSGHGDFGGMRNPHLENLVLNAIDANTPGARYEYSGMGFEIAAKAMELVAGRSAVRLYDEHLFRPLGFGDVPIGNASSDGEFTAMELGILAQWVANRGSYGEWEFITPQTFEKLLPEPLQVADRGHTADEGIGIHWVHHLKPGAAAGSRRPEDLLYGPRTLGHGSFSGCIFVIDPEQQLVIAQVRRQVGPRHAEWSARFFQTIAAAIAP